MKISAKILKREEQDFPIRDDFIRLDSLLKAGGALGTGGQAKLVIQNGEVRVNDETCLQRGKKIRPGDKIEYGRIVLNVKKHENQ